jgi:uncharacterized protein YqjF (DUF2071 family)
MRQRWAGLLFLHWPVAPEIIQARLPDGLFVDTHDGQAWLGVVPFFMERVRPVLLPPMPGLSWFLELNVRTYVHDAEGQPGVWFFSLDCNQPLAVEIARRFFHLPYEHATMQAKFAGNEIDYSSRRKSPSAMEAHYHYQRPTSSQPALLGSLEWFLVERYVLFSSAKDGTLFCGKVHHTPYQISAAHCDHWSTEPLRLNGFDIPSGPPPSMLVAQDVDVRIFPLRKIPSGGQPTKDPNVC